MDETRPSLRREAAGFVLGGLAAATASDAAFLWFFDLPSQPDPRNHTGEAFALIAMVMFFCGGFIGRRSFLACELSDLLRPIVGSYACVIFLSTVASLDFGEVASMAGFASAGIVSSAVATLAVLRWVPPDF